MIKHFETPSAVIVMLIKLVDGKKMILLQRRANTGFADGLWDLSYSGHVEYGESMMDAAVREAAEELGIAIDKCNLKFFTMIHKRDKQCDLTYYNGYFSCEQYSGVPSICEKDKCSQLEWFDMEHLPEDLIPDRRIAIEAYKNNAPYIEYGW
jgi:8-oxo-dGTP pyrophosphatase MutT (NUDIX family)